jgi:hypothetical protein
MRFDNRQDSRFVAQVALLDIDPAHLMIGLQDRDESLAQHPGGAGHKDAH